MIVNIGLFICIAIMLAYIADEEERRKKMKYNDIKDRAIQVYSRLSERLENATKSVERWEKLRRKNSPAYNIEKHKTALGAFHVFNFAKQQVEFILEETE